MRAGRASAYLELLLRTLIASLATLLLVAGCTPAEDGAAQTSPPTLPTIPYAPSTGTSTAPATPQPIDYQPLLITAADLTDDEDTFTLQSKKPQPDGSPGASAFFVNDADNRAISDTVVVYPDDATATATLKQAAATLPTLVSGGTLTPLAVGTDGVTISGTYPDQDKAVTLVFFTEGPALVRLEFQSAPGDATTAQFVTTVAKMQQIALRVGLAEPR
ncbi:hypothetical protein TUM20983_07330 [Mycobacterium antarcticum]|nr:hypothetical protein TUM20983_07330 [Mycolicibacterium sp. TUM20983]